MCSLSWVLDSGWEKSHLNELLSLNETHTHPILWSSHRGQGGWPWWAFSCWVLIGVRNTTWQLRYVLSSSLRTGLALWCLWQSPLIAVTLSNQGPYLVNIEPLCKSGKGALPPSAWNSMAGYMVWQTVYGLCFSPWLVPSAFCLVWAFLIAQLVKNLPAMQETPVWFLGQKDPLEEG